MPRGRPEGDKNFYRIDSMHNPVMEKALQLRSKRGVLEAVKFLDQQGINPELAALALVGSQRVNRIPGLDKLLLEARFPLLAEQSERELVHG